MCRQYQNQTSALVCRAPASIMFCVAEVADAWYSVEISKSLALSSQNCSPPPYLNHSIRHRSGDVHFVRNPPVQVSALQKSLYFC